MGELATFSVAVASRVARPKPPSSLRSPPAFAGRSGAGCGTASTYHSELRKMGNLQARNRWRWLWQPGPTGSPPSNSHPGNASCYWTNWPYITVGLVQRGHSDADIRKIIGGNVLRVVREVFPSDLIVRSGA